MARPRCAILPPAALVSPAFWVYPDVVTFENATVGEASPFLRVAIINKQAITAELGAISASPGFSLSRDPDYPCGGDLAPADSRHPAASGWCLADIGFTPAQAGITLGSLNIPESNGKVAHVLLVGSTGGNKLNPPSVLARHHLPGIPNWPSIAFPPAESFPRIR